MTTFPAKPGIGRPTKFNRQILEADAWIRKIVQKSEARALLKRATNNIISDWRPRFNALRTKSSRIVRLYDLHRKNFEQADPRTLKRRLAKIEQLAYTLHRDLENELPFPAVLPLVEFRGADFAFHRFVPKPRRGPFVDEGAVKQIASGLVIATSEALHVETGRATVDILETLPTSYRRPSRPTNALSENLPGLMGSILHSVGLQGNPCAEIPAYLLSIRKQLSQENK